MQGYQHIVRSIATASLEGKEEGVPGAAVVLSNQGEPWYAQYFESAAEVNAFIAQLTAARLQAFKV